MAGVSTFILACYGSQRKKYCTTQFKMSISFWFYIKFFSLLLNCFVLLCFQLIGFVLFIYLLTIYTHGKCWVKSSDSSIWYCFCTFKRMWKNLTSDMLKPDMSIFPHFFSPSNISKYVSVQTLMRLQLPVGRIQVTTDKLIF